MLLPINWLKSYLDIDITPKDLADGLTYSGSHVESITSMERGIENILIAFDADLSFNDAVMKATINARIPA